MLKIRLISACRRTEMRLEEYHFSTAYSLEEADALLCEWAPDAELFETRKPRAWYCCEASDNANFRDRFWRRCREELPPTGLLWHGHDLPEYRVPHITLEEDFTDAWPAARQERAVAIVSNIGGHPLRRRGIMALRTRLITSPQVDLFGSRLAWSGFRAHALCRPRPPANYHGELPGYWTDRGRFALMAGYKVAVCLENTLEPFYFTEKLVGAVQAGCIPVYHAHHTVREGVLRGAAWVDPADFGFDPRATLEFALAQDLERYQSINRAWLASERVQSTRASAVFAKIGSILGRQVAAGAPPPTRADATHHHPTT